MYVRKWGSCTRRVRYDWIAAFPGNLPPAAKEWVEVGGYDNAAGTRETAEMWNVSWIFGPVTVQKHDIVTAVQLRKDAQSPDTEDSDALGEISLLEGLFCKSRMLVVLFNRVHPTVGSSRGSHHGGCVPVAAADLQYSLRVRQRRDHCP